MKRLTHPQLPLRDSTAIPARFGSAVLIIGATGKLYEAKLAVREMLALVMPACDSVAASDATRLLANSKISLSTAAGLTDNSYRRPDLTPRRQKIIDVPRPSACRVYP
jgi:hypothetical protein